MDWTYAEKWEEEANKEKEYGEPKWSFDCGFKLDFDGGIVCVDSRFYPPGKCESGLWEGNLNISILGEKIISKEFKNKDLDRLKQDVEYFLNNYKLILKAKLLS